MFGRVSTVNTRLRAHRRKQPHEDIFSHMTIQISGFVWLRLCVFISRELAEPKIRSVPLALKHLKTAGMNNVDRPVLSIRTRGLRTASSSFLCRQSSSSYSRIVLSNSSNISSAAAVSRWLTKSLTLWTLDIAVRLRATFLSQTKLKCWSLTLTHADQAKLTLTWQHQRNQRIGMIIVERTGAASLAPLTVSLEDV